MILISDNYVCNNNNKLFHVSVTFTAFYSARLACVEKQERDNTAAGT